MNNHVRFLNHSCIEIKAEDTTILCDPWFEGPAFGDGWSLLYDKSHDINHLAFDYIWLSHEHPDHFSIATLNKLSAPKTFLYQATKDKKVKTFLEKKGHKVIELSNNSPVVFGDLILTCVVCDGYDSSLIVKFPDGRILVNINDARVDLNNYLDQEIIPLLNGDNVDLLMFQFGYANWAGNKGDFNIPKHQQNLVDCKNEYAISKLSPKMIMPFASFVYFSHEENFYWNDHSWFDHICKKYKNLKPNFVFPKPNQTILMNSIDSQNFSKVNSEALKFWNSIHDGIEVKYFSKSFSVDQLENQYSVFLSKLHKDNSIFSSLNENDNFFLKLKIIDLDLVIEVGLLFESFKVINDNDNEIVANISSEIFMSLFKQLFARGTITINSRISFNYELAHRFFLFFFIPYANNIGITFNHLNKVSKKMLESIVRTSVMDSIVKFNSQSKVKMKEDIDILYKILDVFRDEDSSYEIFNEEPQNTDIENYNN